PRCALQRTSILFPYTTLFRSGEVVALYRKQMDAIVAHGGIPILFQTSRLHGKSSAEKAGTYAAVCRGYSHVLAFELGPMFATNRSEEHTSELQSPDHLVCRLL